MGGRIPGYAEHAGEIVDDEAAVGQELVDQIVDEERADAALLPVRQDRRVVPAPGALRGQRRRPLQLLDPDLREVQEAVVAQIQRRQAV